MPISSSAGDADDLAGAGVLHLDALQAFEDVELDHLGLHDAPLLADDGDVLALVHHARGDAADGEPARRSRRSRGCRPASAALASPSPAAAARG